MAAREPEAGRLAAADFDNTIALTFEPAASRIGVNEAYDIAIAELFGRFGLESYRDQGGLRNRAAGEVVAQLLPDNAPPEEIEQRTKELVKVKLAVLLNQIDKTWPKPTPGFLEAWQKILHAREAGSPIATAVISSGHDSFIRSTFATWGVPLPDLLITSEAMHRAAPDATVSEIAKPGPLSMHLALAAWLGASRHEDITAETLADAARRTVYIGDALHADGELAAKFDIPFVLLDPAHSAPAWETYTTYLGIGSSLLHNEVTITDVV